jgi:probable phosphoglycerate mutase
MELYIIRHGETIWNAAGKLQGHADIELNENGIALAEVTSKALLDVKFDAIYSSPLIRAKHTANIICGNRAIDIIEDQRLKEIGFGDIEGKDFKLLENMPEYGFDNFFNKPEAYVPTAGGETIEQLCQRSANFMDEVIRNSKHNTVLIVAHAALNKSLLRYIKKLELKDFWSGEFQKNCAVTIAEINGDHMHIKQEGKIYY